MNEKTFRLNDNYALRKWTDTPYALCNLEFGETLFLGDIQFQALSFCDGRTNTNSFYILPIHRKYIDKFKELNIISESDRKLDDYQKLKEFNNEYVHTAHWSITGKCNFKCRHCCMSSPSHKYDELSLDKCLYIIDQLHQCGINNVSLTGGEPLLRKDFLDIIDALIKNRINISHIYTNGSLVDEKLLNEIKNRNLRPIFSLSFDGLCFHDWLRNVTGAEQMAIKAIKLINKYEFPIDVEMCLHRLNSHTLESTINYLASIGVTSLKTNPVGNSGEWIKENGKYDLTYEELYDIYLDYIPKFLNNHSPLSLHLGGFFYCDKGTKDYIIPAEKFDGTVKALDCKLCDHAKKNMYISPDGSILPCFSLSGLEIDNKTNIIEIPLSSALKDSHYLALVNYKLKDLLDNNETCNNCEHKLTCGGGCRASALISDKNYLGIDKSICTIFKNDYINKIKNTIRLDVI